MKPEPAPLQRSVQAAPELRKGGDRDDKSRSELSQMLPLQSPPGGPARDRPCVVDVLNGLRAKLSMMDTEKRWGLSDEAADVFAAVGLKGCVQAWLLGVKVLATASDESYLDWCLRLQKAGLPVGFPSPPHWMSAADERRGYIESTWPHLEGIMRQRLEARSDAELQRLSDALKELR